MTKKMTYEELMYFEHGERNIRNCINCPYKDEYKEVHLDYALPCDRRDCWPDIVHNLDKKHKNHV